MIDTMLFVGTTIIVALALIFSLVSGLITIVIVRRLLNFQQKMLELVAKDLPQYLTYHPPTAKDVAEELARKYEDQ